MEKRFLKIYDSQSTYESNWESEMNLKHVVLLNDTKEIVFNGAKGEDEPSEPSSSYEYVDLGLPSGTLWAKCNIGAEAEEDYGFYFAWGSTVGATQEEVENGTFTFGTGGNAVAYVDPTAPAEAMFTKYNSTDGLTELEPQDDAATVHMGAEWKLPSKEQLEELTANTTSEWTTINGVNGRKFTSKVNGNYIFVPAASGAHDYGMGGVESNGDVWSSSVHSSYSSTAWYLFFHSSNVDVNNFDRMVGCSARGVKQ